MSTGIIMGNSTAINVIQLTLDIGSVAANTTEEETLTVTGVKLGDYVHVTPLTFNAGLAFTTAAVTAADTVAITVVNATASPINAASQTVQVLVIRPEGIPSQQTKLSF